MKKTKIRILIIIFICISLIGILFVMIKIQKKTLVDEKYTVEDIGIINNELEKYLSDKIVPKGLSRLYGAYQGDNEFNDLYRKLYLLVDYLPELSKNALNKDERKINKYFEENKSDINNKLGIYSIENFMEFIKYLENINYNRNKFLDCQIISKNFKDVNGYFVFDLKFDFENLNNEFVLKVHFSNSKSKEPIVFYSM